MRLIAFLILLGTHFAVHAEPKPEPLPNTPIDESPADEPDVMITKKNDMTIEEYRTAGKLYMIKITPKVGKPYYLVDDRGDGKFARQESLDSGFRVPRWILHSF